MASPTPPSRRSRSPVVSALLDALGRGDDLTTLALYWIVRSSIKPETAHRYYRKLSRPLLVKDAPLERALELGGEKVVYHSLRNLFRSGVVERKTDRQATRWKLAPDTTDEGETK